MIFLGLDVGSSGTKCVAFSEDGRQLAVCYREYTTRAGQADMDAREMFAAVCDVISGCAADSAVDKSNIKHYQKINNRNTNENKPFVFIYNICNSSVCSHNLSIVIPISKMLVDKRAEKLYVKADDESILPYGEEDNDNIQHLCH